MLRPHCTAPPTSHSNPQATARPPPKEPDTVARRPKTDSKQQASSPAKPALFKRILIANRGEIALRVIRACKELGIETVAVYSEADKNYNYIKYADDAICIGPPAAADSYLKIDRIIAAAEITDVEAIHPGYGFLSENPHFAEICRSCKIEFIGPSVRAMQALGSKIESKKLAKLAKVPLVPGSEGALDDEAHAVALANQIGYPVILKASAGGGGRGMRVCHNDISTRANFNAARAEAEKAFGDSAIFMEKFLVEPRHVEIQILGDRHGNLIHLFERDCTLQRRNQKLIEESPSPHISDSTRKKMCEAAVRIAKQVNYDNAGTCEFLVDKQENFYFCEINARIQVEHPVTELVTGVDLVQWQIKIASGLPLTLKQADIKTSGHAIQCRINAEDVRGFIPMAGPVDVFHAPGGPGVRLDTHMTSANIVPPFYDSMIAKLLVHRANRSEAIACMARALREFHVGPVKTIIPFHLWAMANADFRNANVDIHYIERLYRPS